MIRHNAKSYQPFRYQYLGYSYQSRIRWNHDYYNIYVSNMSFSGKKFRRTRCVNVHEMLRHTRASLETIHILTNSAPVFSFIRLDEKTFIFKLILQDRVMSHKFRLGEEFEMQRHNGTKVKITYTLEGDDVLNQIIKHPDGKVVFFRREFGASNKMIITMQGMNEPAVIYYELVE